MSKESKEFIITGLKANESYVVQVASFDATRNVTLDVVIAEGDSHTDPEPSPEPTGVSVEAVRTNSSSSQVVIKWGPSDVSSGPPVDGYIITVCPAGNQRSQTEDNDSCKTIRTSSEDTEVVLDGLKQFEDYEVVVRSFVKRGSREVEGHATTIMVTTSPPHVPTVAGLRITSLNSSSSSVSWSAPAGLENFSVVYNVTIYLTGATNELTWHEVNETGIILTGLSEWTNYTVKIYVCLVRAGKRHCGDFTLTDFKTPPKGKLTGLVSHAGLNGKRFPHIL